MAIYVALAEAGGNARMILLLSSPDREFLDRYEKDVAQMVNRFVRGTVAQQTDAAKPSPSFHVSSPGNDPVQGVLLAMETGYDAAAFIRGGTACGYRGRLWSHFGMDSLRRHPERFSRELAKSGGAASTSKLLWPLGGKGKKLKVVWSGGRTSEWDNSFEASQGRPDERLQGSWWTADVAHQTSVDSSVMGAAEATYQFSAA